MPDHVHFFAFDWLGQRDLSHFVGKWKEWTAKLSKERLGMAMPLWQPDFFDHVLRSPNSHGEKWNYVRENPVRGGLVRLATDWQFQGEMNEIRID